MRNVLTLLLAVCVSLYTLPVLAQSCPEQLDKQQRLTLTLAKENDTLKDSSSKWEAQKQLYISNETLLRSVNASSEKLVGKYTGMWEDAEKRATRSWIENPFLWFSVGVAVTLGFVAASVAVYEKVIKQ